MREQTIYITQAADLDQLKQEIQLSVRKKKLVLVYQKKSRNQSSRHWEAIYYSKNSKTLYQLLDCQTHPTNHGQWRAISLKPGRMKKVFQKDWEYTFYTWENKVNIISCVCGRAAVYDINHVLSASEAKHYQRKGEEYLDSLSKKIQFSGQSEQWNTVNYE